MADLVDAVAQLVREGGEDGVLLRQQGGGEVHPLLHPLEQTDRQRERGRERARETQRERLLKRSTESYIRKKRSEM